MRRLLALGEEPILSALQRSVERLEDDALQFLKNRVDSLSLPRLFISRVGCLTRMSCYGMAVTACHTMVV
jgi:hypothetical protein